MTSIMTITLHWPPARHHRYYFARTSLVMPRWCSDCLPKGEPLTLCFGLRPQGMGLRPYALAYASAWAYTNAVAYTSAWASGPMPLILCL